MKNEYGKEIQEGVSLIACCMDRNEHLKQVLPNWLSFGEIDEIIIVDWSSQEPLETIVGAYDDPRLLLVRVEDEPDWALPYPANLAARLSSRSRILKLDTDTRLSETFFSENVLIDGVYYQGNGFEDRGLTGMLYVYREDFFAINGFSEYLRNYAWEDTDIFNRLLLARGLRNRYMKEGSATHIPHSDAMRMARQSSVIGFDDCDLPKLIEETLEIVSESAIPELGATLEARVARLRELMFDTGRSEAQFMNVIARHPIYNIMRSRHVCEEFPWSSELEMARFATLDEKPGFLRVARDKSRVHAVPDDRMLAAKRYGLAKLFYSKYPALQSAVKEFETARRSSGLLEDKLTAGV